MTSSFIYHGGGQGKQGFSSVPKNSEPEEYFTLCFSTGEDMAINDLINPPTEISFSVTGAGYHIPKAAKLLSWNGLAISYSKISAGEIGLSLRYSPADGSRTSTLISITGTVYHNIVWLFPATGGVTKFYWGGYEDGLEKSIPANSVIHCAVNAINLTDLDGIVLWCKYKFDD